MYRTALKVWDLNSSSHDNGNSSDMRISDFSFSTFADNQSLCFSGELVGHRDLVSGFSFCQHAGQNHICVSSSNDGSIFFWDSSTRVLLREHAAHQVSVDSSCFCLVSVISVSFIVPHFVRDVMTTLCLTGSGQFSACFSYI